MCSSPLTFSLNPTRRKWLREQAGYHICQLIDRQERFIGLAREVFAFINKCLINPYYMLGTELAGRVPSSPPQFPVPHPSWSCVLSWIGRPSHTEKGHPLAGGLQAAALLAGAYKHIWQGAISPSFDAFQDAIRRHTPNGCPHPSPGRDKKPVPASLRKVWLVCFALFLTQGAFRWSRSWFTQIRRKVTTSLSFMPAPPAEPYPQIPESAKRYGCQLQTLFGYLKGYNVDGFFVCLGGEAGSI